MASQASLCDKREEARQVLFQENHTIDYYYPPFFSERLKTLITNYYQNLCALDHSMTLYEKQQKLLDQLLEIAKKSLEKD